ncbi:hypothetical protein [Roseovarius sp. ZX-A-9]|uniref:hypothetical protein n=1 Tax=Roseovarius sp. ZX-A-9 TaxID=3014783 RepID=UPI00232F03FC|nr:hypothetical protein [Roseovarius sp. ZX-A-9]MDX1785773.1 hypothetical protein [Roseovarius sp.]
MRLAPVTLSITMILVAALSACSQFPELDAVVSDDIRDAPYPDLVPLDTLDIRTGPGRITPGTAQTVEARVARLKARAARLRRTVIDGDTRARMRDGIAS